MKINPRAKELHSATIDIRMALHKASEKYDLSTSELMLILTESTYKIFNNLVRAEHQSEE